MSLAFYASDPEGNGLELYIDRPADEWVWKDGEVTMGSAALDPNAFIEEHLGADAVATTTTATMGHVHLKVGNLETARAFYVDTLGFAVTANSDGALFMSAGGYHHHLAANTWNSAGAGERSASLGLGSFSVVLPTQADIDDAAQRLTNAGVAFERTDAGLTVADPWGNVVQLSLAASA